MSMLDDPGVVAGLEGLDAPGQPRSTTTSDPDFLSGVHDLDSGLTHLAPDESVFLDDPPDEYEDEPAEPSVEWTTLLRSHLGVWVICGSFGAAAAALVFHAQVSRIWQWSGAATSLWR